jgi:hypothetical protein
MEPAPERDHAAMRGSASGGELGDQCGLPIEMTTEPWLTLGEERHGVSFTVALPGAGRDRHDHAAIGV